jgi:hypothetical protein
MRDGDKWKALRNIAGLSIITNYYSPPLIN